VALGLSNHSLEPSTITLQRMLLVACAGAWACFARAAAPASKEELAQAAARAPRRALSPAAVVLVGAGDIASCPSTGAEATATLLDQIPGTVITIGDNAYPNGATADFARCYDLSWGRQKTRTRPVPGDHDYGTPDAAGYFDYFGAAAGERGKGYYSYDLGAWHIVALNSVIPNGPGSLEVRWLEADLAASPKRCTLAYFHHPRFFSSIATSPGGGVNDFERAVWGALYAAGADIVLNGDQHQYERFAPQAPDGQLDTSRGIREFIVGTGGASVAAPTSIRANSEVRNGDTFGVLKLTLGADRYAWDFIPVAGRTFHDAGRGRCHDRGDPRGDGEPGKPHATILTDPTRVLSEPAVAKPAYLAPIFPAPFDLAVTRIADDSGSVVSFHAGGVGTWGSDARHHYSNDQPWSADGTLLALQNSGSPDYVYLDGETYKPVRGRCANYDYYDDRWHPRRAHAHERINVNRTTRLSWFDVVACTETRHWTLPFPVIGIGGNPSDDGRFVALSDGRRFVVVDMDPHPPFAPYPNRRIGPPVDMTWDCGLSAGCPANWVSISPSGTYVVVNYHGDHLRVYDLNPGTLAATPRPMATVSPRCSGTAAEGFIYDLGHQDMTLDPFDHGEDVIIGQEHCGNRGKRVEGVLMGGVVMVRLRDGAITSVTNPTNEAYPYHISTRNYDRPGWAYVSYWTAPGRRFNDEIVSVKLDGSGTVERYAHIHTETSGCYRCEAHAVPTRDGRRVLWASNWMTNGGGTGAKSVIQAYVVDAR